MTEPQLVELRIGRPFASAFPERIRPAYDEPDVLTITDLHGGFFGPISLSVGRGEILGVAGVEGNGQGDFFHTLSGRIPPKGGIVTCEGRHVDLISPGGALRSGIVLLAGDRKRESLFPVLGVRSNATIQELEKVSSVGWVNRGKERGIVAQLVDRLKIRTPSLEQPVMFLSGGNQQKVSLSRSFLRETVKVILADEPTQGVDIASRFDIYEALHSKAAEGAAIVLKSSDPIELAGFCHRVIVISRGQIVNEIRQDELSERKIIEAMVSGVKLGSVAEQFAAGDPGEAE
jgi:ribose transport system ATP-binding protein